MNDAFIYKCDLKLIVKLKLLSISCSISCHYCHLKYLGELLINTHFQTEPIHFIENDKFINVCPTLKIVNENYFSIKFVFF
jgi:hypothetical protein